MPGTTPRQPLGRTRPWRPNLSGSAGRAQGRGGIAAAAAFLQRAAELTLDPLLRARRTLAAAQARHQAGAPGPALALLAIAQAGPLDELQRARADLLIAQITEASRRSDDGPALLLAAARQLQDLDPALARDTYLEAFSAAMLAGRLAGDVGGPEVAKAARKAPRPSQRQLNGDLLLAGRAVLFTEGYKAALPISKQALRAFCSADTPPEEGLRWLFLAAVTAADLWDDESWHVLSARHARIARAAGAAQRASPRAQLAHFRGLVRGRSGRSRVPGRRGALGEGGDREPVRSLRCPGACRLAGAGP